MSFTLDSGTHQVRDASMITDLDKVLANDPSGICRPAEYRNGTELTMQQAVKRPSEAFVTDTPKEEAKGSVNFFLL